MALSKGMVEVVLDYVTISLVALGKQLPAPLQRVSDQLASRPVMASGFLVFALLRLVRAFRTPNPVDSLPGNKPLWLVGNVGVGLIESPTIVEQMEATVEKHGNLSKYKLAHRTYVLVSDGNAVRKMYMERPRRFKRSTDTRPDGLAHNLFSAAGDEWKEQRHLTTPAFSNQATTEFGPILSCIANRLVNVWEKNAAASPLGEVDAHATLTKAATDLTCRVGFGVDLNTLEDADPNSTESKALPRMVEAAFAQIACPGFLNTRFGYWLFPYLGEMAEVRSQCVALARRVLQKKVAALEADGRTARGGKGDVMDRFLASELSHEKIVSNTLLLLAAGSDTTSNLISWCLYYLALDYELQAQVRAEVDSLLPVGTRAPDCDIVGDGSKFPLLVSCLTETLRIKSPAPALDLEAEEDVEVSGKYFPRGTIFFCLSRPAQLATETYGADALAFRPQRWQEATLSESSKQLWGESFLAFGGGARVCPGRNLAMREGLYLLAAIISSFDFKLGATSSFKGVVEKFGGVVHPSTCTLSLRVRQA